MFDIEALDQATFSWQTALNLCLASQASYLDRESAIAAAKEWGFDHVEHLSSNDTQGIIAYTDDLAMLAFRGTESIGDWMTNIQIIGKNRHYGRVHKGFHRAFKDVRDDCRNVLTNGNFEHVFFCGHSLGGALATIAMAEMADIPAQYKAGYTYGQPKTGKRSFRDYFNQHHGGQFFRYVNDGDIVPRVPPAYRHVGQLHVLSDNEGLEALAPEIRELTEQEFEALQAEIAEALEQYRLVESNLEAAGSQTEDEYLEGVIPGVAAHDMNLYISRIKERLDNDNE
jgi:hypothetical protein